MSRWKCLRKVKGWVALFLTLSWMACIVYTLLMKLTHDMSDHNHVSGENYMLLSELGFHEQPKLYPQAYHLSDDKTWPVFALAIGNKDIDSFIDFLLLFRKYFLDHRLVVFNLGMTSQEKNIVKERCFCQVREVQWRRYPKHVRNKRLQAYLPLLIQDTLQEFGSVFWCESSMKFNTSDIKTYLQSQTLQYGITGWTRDRYPTSTFTHYNSYNYFNLNQSDFYFHKMVHPLPALYYNVESLHSNIMQPWVECALNENCISPVGAQFSGCNMNLKPRYRYSGCHRYSTSILNVLLGKTYNFKTPYIGRYKVYENELETSSNLLYEDLWLV